MRMGLDLSDAAERICLQDLRRRQPEDDGRWIAELPVLPGVLAYGPTRAEAVARVEALALRVLADRLELGEDVPPLGRLFAAA